MFFAGGCDEERASRYPAAAPNHIDDLSRWAHDPTPENHAGRKGVRRSSGTTRRGLYRLPLHPIRRSRRGMALKCFSLTPV